MRLLVALKKINPEAGFTLLELIIVTVIVGIATATSVANLVKSQRDNEAKLAFTKLKGALIEAQVNANRKSQDCKVNIQVGTDKYTIEGSPSGCLLEGFTIDKNVVILESNGNLSTIAYDFEGDTGNAQTLLISPNDFEGNPLREAGKCIVIAANLGMIRTGVYIGSSTGNFNRNDCFNSENKKYDSFN